MKFAKVINGVVEGYPEFPTQPECKVIDGKATIRPLIELPAPAYDFLTQTIVRQENIFDDRVELSWVVTQLPLDQADLNISNNAKAKLYELDAKSIRPIREWLASQPQAPQFVKDLETQAVAERAKLKP